MLLLKSSTGKLRVEVGIFKMRSGVYTFTGLNGTLST